MVFSTIHGMVPARWRLHPSRGPSRHGPLREAATPRLDSSRRAQSDASPRRPAGLRSYGRSACRESARGYRGTARSAQRTDWRRHPRPSGRLSSCDRTGGFPPIRDGSSGVSCSRSIVRATGVPSPCNLSTRTVFGGSSRKIAENPAAQGPRPRHLIVRGEPAAGKAAVAPDRTIGGNPPVVSADSHRDDLAPDSGCAADASAREPRSAR